jgi:hypothetical protein
MRLVDAILRQGHLSERTVVEAILTGERPPHLDRCDICAERALTISRSLDVVRSAAHEAAEAAFPAERLAAQHAQIMRRLEQVDEPTRVITFPGQARHNNLDGRASTRRRVAPAWVGVGAAAGLVIGAIGGQVSARFNQQTVVVQPAPPPAPAVSAPGSPTTALATTNASLLELDTEALTAFMPQVLEVINDATPRMAQSRQ